MKHRIQLILPHRLFVEGLIRLLDETFEITDENPELALIDVSLLREGIVSPDVKIVAIGGALPDLSLMVSLGVQGYVRGSVGCSTLVSIIELVLADHAVWPSEVLRGLAAPPFRPDAIELPVYRLTPREMMLADMLRQGLSNKQIALTTGIVEATVKVHVKAILRKLRLDNRTQVAVWATKRAGRVLGQATQSLTTSIHQTKASNEDRSALSAPQPQDRLRPLTLESNIYV